MNNNSIEQNPKGLLSLLEDFVEVLYLRFEAGRSAYLECKTTDVLLSIPAGGSKYCFPRILNRKNFVEVKGTYLDDLKADIEHAGEHREWALDMLRRYCQESRIPLCNSPDPTWSISLDPFFPNMVDLRGIASKDRRVETLVLEYMKELFELQQWLVEVGGCEPGWLLPAWKTQSATGTATIQVLPVNRKVTETCLHFLAWDVGGYGYNKAVDNRIWDDPWSFAPELSARRKSSNKAATVAELQRDRKDIEFVARAIRLARRMAHHKFVAWHFKEETGLDPAEIRALDEVDRRKLLETSSPGYAQHFAHSLGDIMLEDLIETGDYLGEADDRLDVNTWKIENGQIRGTEENGYINNPAARRKFNEACEYGAYLIQDGYRDLW